MQDYSIPVRVRDVQPGQNQPNQSMSVGGSTGSGNPLKNFYDKNRLAIWAIIASLAVIGAILVVIFHKPAAITPPKVSLQISAPAKVSTASNTVYQLTVTNSDTSPVKNVSIDVLYPPGFTFVSSAPPATSTDGTTFSLAELDPGQNAAIAITGKTAGNNGQVQQLNAVMHYQFANTTTDFVAQAQAQSLISDSGIALQVSGQQQANNGQASTYTFSYTNTTPSATSPLTMVLGLPIGFTVASETPNLQGSHSASQTLTWILPALPANGNASVQVVGAFSGLSSGTQGNFTVEIDGAVNGQSAVLASTTYQVTVVVNPISATVTLSSASGALNSQSATSVDPGAQLSYSVAYQNSGSVAATGVNVSVVLVGDAYDLTTLSAPMASISGNTITWNGSQVQQLADLTPNQEGSLTFNVGVKNPATKGDVANMVVTATPQIQSDQFQQAFSGNPVSLKINTQLSLDETANASSGPNPPAVGQQTTYMVVLALRNTTNSAGNVQVTASLPQAYNFDPTLVTFVEQKNVKYDPGTRKLTWNVGTLPAHTGDYNPVRKLVLTVTVLPDQTSTGQTLPLLTNVAVTGTDTFTSNQISFSGSTLTTSSDPSGNGTVVAN